MAKRNTADVIGLNELNKALKNIDKDLRDKDLSFATQKAAKPFEIAAKQRVHVDSGSLRDDIATRKSTKYSHLDAEYSVGVLKRTRSSKKGEKVVPPGVYGQFLEYGTSREPAHPFMRPALDAEKPHLLSNFQKTFSKRFASRVKKNKAKTIK